MNDGTRRNRPLRDLLLHARSLEAHAQSRLDIYTKDEWEILAQQEGLLDSMIEAARGAESSWRELRLQMESLRAGESRLCATCNEPFARRADSIYCSSACRQKAYRARHRSTDSLGE